MEPPGGEGLDVLGVVAEPAQVLAPPEVAEAEPRLPRHRHHEAAAGDAGQLRHRGLERREVLEQLDAGDEVAGAVGDGSMPASADRAGQLRQPLAGEQHLVEPVLEADRRVAVGIMRSRASPSPTPTSIDGAVDGAEHLAQPAHPAGEEPLHDRVAGVVLLRVLAGGRLGRARARGRSASRSSWARSSRGRPRPMASRLRRRRRLTMSSPSRPSDSICTATTTSSTPSWQRRAGADVVAGELRDAHPARAAAPPTSPITNPMPPKRWNGRAV